MHNPSEGTRKQNKKKGKTLQKNPNNFTKVVSILFAKKNNNKKTTTKKKQQQKKQKQKKLLGFTQKRLFTGSHVEQEYKTHT